MAPILPLVQRPPVPVVQCPAITGPVLPMADTRFDDTARFAVSVVRLTLSATSRHVIAAAVRDRRNPVTSRKCCFVMLATDWPTCKLHTQADTHNIYRIAAQ